VAEMGPTHCLHLPHRSERDDIEMGRAFSRVCRSPEQRRKRQRPHASPNRTPTLRAPKTGHGAHLRSLALSRGTMIPK